MGDIMRLYDEYRSKLVQQLINLLDMKQPKPNKRSFSEFCFGIDCKYDGRLPDWWRNLNEKQKLVKYNLYLEDKAYEY